MTITSLEMDAICHQIEIEGTFGKNCFKFNFANKQKNDVLSNLTKKSSTYLTSLEVLNISILCQIAS